MKAPPVTREQLTLFGAVLKLQHPNGEKVDTPPSDISVTVERPDLRRPWHSSDWSNVIWNGRSYKLSPKQRLVVALLWKAWEDGTSFLSGVYLLNRADSDQPRLAHLFKGHPAWNELVVSGEPYGGDFDTFCLAPPAEDE